jgi:hypothetical protein
VTYDQVNGRLFLWRAFMGRRADRCRSPPVVVPAGDAFTRSPFTVSDRRRDSAAGKGEISLPLRKGNAAGPWRSTSSTRWGRALVPGVVGRGGGGTRRHTFARLLEARAVHETGGPPCG